MTDPWLILADRLARIDDRLTALTDALKTGDVCCYLGHTYHVPDVTLRRKVEVSGLEIERRCERCGESDGLWQPCHWTLDEFAVERAARVPQPKKVMA